MGRRKAVIRPFRFVVAAACFAAFVLAGARESAAYFLQNLVVNNVIYNVSVTDWDGNPVFFGDVDLNEFLRKPYTIAKNGTRRYIWRDIHANWKGPGRPGQLPFKEYNYYKEYAPWGGDDRRRVVIGKSGEVYFTPNHYDDWIIVKGPPPGEEVYLPPQPPGDGPQAPGGGVGAPPLVPAPVIGAGAIAAAPSWTGFYVGGYAGYAWDWNSSVTAPDAVPSLHVLPGVTVPVAFAPASYLLGHSGIAGGTFGYNYQNGWVVIGSEVEVGWINMSGAGTYNQFTLPGSPALPCPGVGFGFPSLGLGACPTSSATLGNWYATWTGRVGVTGQFLNPAWTDGSRLLIYTMAGPAVTQWSDAYILNCRPELCPFPEPSSLVSGTRTIYGVALGAGFEWAFASHWSAKLEYELLMFPNLTPACGPAISFSGTGACSQINFQSGGIETVKVGVNYRFDWGGPTVAH